MSFYSFAPSAPNEYEVFFYSLLLCMNAPLVKELDEWVGEVLLQRSSALEHKARRLGCLKAPRRTTCRCSSTRWRPRSWASETTTRSPASPIAAAMRFWDGPERIDLEASHLKNYFKRGLRGVSKSNRKPNDGPPRWRTWAIVDVAAFVRKHGVASTYARL